MSTGNTQAKRRTLFGLNAGVAAATAVSIVVLLNWLVWWQYAAAPPSVKRFIRLDLSATRAHSLSPQTRRVLAGLQAPVTVMAVFRDDARTASELSAARRRNLEDLMEEYARASRLVSTRSLSAGASSGGADEANREVALRFAKEMRPLQENLAQAHAHLAALAQALAQSQDDLSAVANAAYAGERTQAQARTAANTLARLRQKLTAQVEDSRKTLAMPMPDYLRLQQAAYDLVVSGSKDFSSCHDALAGTLANAAPPLEGQMALDAAAALKQAAPLFQKAADRLLGINVPQAYEQARAALSTGESLVVLTDARARVVPADRLLRRVSGDLARAGAGAQDTGSEQFTGEEQITGALVGLSQAVPPRVVFLQSDAGYALTPEGGQHQGLFQAMGDRLRAMEVDVDEANVWHPKAVNENGEPLNLRPALPGQKTVWVLCPFREPNLKQPASLKMDNRIRTCAFLRKQLEKGDGALILLNQDPLPDPERVKVADEALGAQASYADRHPINALLKAYGIEAQNWTVLAHEEQEPGMQPVPSVPVQIRHYPQDTDLGRALEGLALRLERPCPVVPAAPLPPGIRTHELVDLALPRLYTLDFDALHGGGKQAYNPKTALAHASVALAVEANLPGKPETRLVAVGDPLWATDLKTTFGFHPELAPISGGGAVGMSNIPGGISAWPGNAELFVNAIHWLAHEDDLIAPGARSQDVRRIGPVSDGTGAALRWLLLAGLPAGAAAAGLLVWARRRKF